MKSVRLILIPLALFFVIACGGGEVAGPPPNMSLVSPAGQAFIEEGIAKLDAIKNGQCDSYAQPFAALSLTRNANDVARVAPFITGAQPNGGCDDSLKNAIWLFSHAMKKDATPWINDPNSMSWMVRKVAANLTAWSRRNGLDAMRVLQNPNLVGAFVNQNLMPRIGSANPQFAGIVSQYTR